MLYLFIHVGVSPLQLVNLHRNRRYFVIKLHTWFCLSYFLKTNINFYCIYQYFMSINSFFNTVSVSRYSRPITVTVTFVILDIVTVQLAYRKYSKIVSMKCFIPLYKSSCVKSNESTKKLKMANVSI
jgi:hypothetical protein